MVVVTKEFQGQISAITPQFINVVYKSDKEKGIEHEMFISIGKDVELRYKRMLSELRYGDTVSVRYDEKQRTVETRGDDGRVKTQTQIASREAKLITFLKPAKQGMVSED